MNTTVPGAPTPSERRVSWKYLLPGSTALIIAASLAVPEVTSGMSVDEHIGYMLRVTARLAFALLLVAYVAGPLVKLFGTGHWMLRNRRYIGLSMALAHTVHFGYVVALFVYTPATLEWVTIVGGGLAFVLMWLMAATSNNVSVRRFGKNWKRLHTFGLHYLWLIFMQSFAPRAFAEEVYLLYPLLTAAGVAALGLRVWAYWRARS